jgi:hypothetical protein
MVSHLQVVGVEPVSVRVAKVLIRAGIVALAPVLQPEKLKCDPGTGKLFVD